MNQFWFIFGVIGILVLAVVILILVIAKFRFKWLPKDYPYLVVLDYAMLANTIWSAAHLTSRIYVVPIGPKPYLRPKNWSMGILERTRDTYELERGDFVIYPIKNGLPAILMVIDRYPDKTYQTTFVGVFRNANTIKASIYNI